MAAKGAGGLSAARQRQLDRALRKKQGRAGKHYYEAVNVKNKSRRRSGGGGGKAPPLAGPMKRGRKSK